MELSPLYLQQLQKAKEEGIQQEQRLMVESMLQVKFGVVDAELAQIIEGLIEIPTLERTQLIWQLSREELLARVSHGGEG